MNFAFLMGREILKPWRVYFIGKGEILPVIAGLRPALTSWVLGGAIFLVTCQLPLYIPISPRSSLYCLSSCFTSDDPHLSNQTCSIYKERVRFLLLVRTPSFFFPTSLTHFVHLLHSCYPLR